MNSGDKDPNPWKSIFPQIKNPKSIIFIQKSKSKIAKKTNLREKINLKDISLMLVIQSEWNDHEFDEEAVDRYAFEIEQLIKNFVR